MITITIPFRTVSESNMREHHMAKARRVKWQRNVVGLAVRPRVKGMAHPLPCSVLMTRVAPRPLDDDNLRGALKATRDQIAAELGVDDRDPRVVWRYAQRRGGKGVYAVEIVFTPVSLAEDAETHPGATSCEGGP